MWRVLGRWLLYTLVGFVLLLMLLGGGGDLGSEEPKGSWRSILLSMGGLISALAGGFVYWSDRVGGPLGEYWPTAGWMAWIASATLVVTAWSSIAQDLEREARRGRL